ncbi:hypothetical protein DYB35_011033 [Aphanomyces astaci]|uniref:Uncharacterized protein n=1 Tax=Aphanomyces astaci TaxID=112090 RepID=A0A418CZM5_APHAT|nr:hypothetical protein DYB35_011033 [Aphanomyces astaci]
MPTNGPMAALTSADPRMKRRFTSAVMTSKAWSASCTRLSKSVAFSVWAVNLCLLVVQPGLGLVTLLPEVVLPLLQGPERLFTLL